jgi:hypothetical protein
MQGEAVPIIHVLARASDITNALWQLKRYIYSCETNGNTYLMFILLDS